MRVPFSTVTEVLLRLIDSLSDDMFGYFILRKYWNKFLCFGVNFFTFDLLKAYFCACTSSDNVQQKRLETFTVQSTCQYERQNQPISGNHHTGGH